jgi:hypothetical protein
LLEEPDYLFGVKGNHLTGFYKKSLKRFALGEDMHSLAQDIPGDNVQKAFPLNAMEDSRKDGLIHN